MFFFNCLNICVSATQKILCNMTEKLAAGDLRSTIGTTASKDVNNATATPVSILCFLSVF